MHRSILSSNPDSAPYCRWRDAKLAAQPARPEQFLIDIADPLKLTADERKSLQYPLQHYRFVIFRTRKPAAVDKNTLRELGLQFGLTTLDGNLCADDDQISSLRVFDHGRGNAYIPYSNKPLSWHTDGYYNPASQRIHSLILYCVQDAAEGGDNQIMDHEMAYIQLREHKPLLASALEQPDALTIPANIENGEQIRSATVGPVFFLSPQDGQLYMRYSARERNIVWKDDPLVREAVKELKKMMHPDNPYVYQYRLKPGEGLLSANILHRRLGFADTDAQQRLMFRARYFEALKLAES
ncbi:MAG: TauD/TfdA family dioxygenase [gamma proteobacterium symbiont of Bathyaustriella thionipta]|nr:TauD/TfdA family dioxygenase [gamma proteobacterium symbiont of Bathyaustriella thionipta]